MPLSVISFNLQAGVQTAQLGDYVTQSWRHFWPNNQTQHNLDQAAKILSQFDITGVQEADAGSRRSKHINQVQWLAEQASHPHYSWQVNRNVGRYAQHSLGITSRFELHDPQQHRLPGLIPGRGALTAQINYQGRKVLVVVVHLALGKRSRQRQLAYLAALVKQHQYVILLGDTNCDLQQLNDSAMSSTHLSPLSDVGNTHPSWNPKRQLDHIFVSEGFTVNKVWTEAQTYSDHLAVAAELELSAAD